MNKLLGIIPVLASLCFGDVFNIDLSIPHQGWSHDSASLVGINVGSYINEGETLESAVLKFTGIQNLMEPENNDALYISLLSLNNSFQGNTFTILYGDDQSSTSNLFQVRNDPNYTWIEGKSHLLTYTDDNDGADIKIEYDWKGAYWETTPEHQIEIEKGLREGYAWRYEQHKPKGYSGEDWGWWSKISNYNTDSFNIDLDLSTVKEFMGLSNDWLVLGIDADCHYTGKVELEITTTKVPEPSSLSLLLLGFVSLTGAFFTRKRN